MVLGAVLHHDGHPCEGGALGGSEKAEDIADEQDSQARHGRSLMDRLDSAGALRPEEEGEQRMPLWLLYLAL